MANEFRSLESHSAEYFGDTRDYWWNLDFLRLMGERLSLDRARDVLDVGCGVGHWGQLLAHVLHHDANVEGVDRDPLWVEKASVRAAAHGLSDRFHYRAASVEALPFATASFDLVTCQTLLIHTPDAGAAIDEMIRVTRPGGLILVSEPNNLATALTFDSITVDDPVGEILGRVRLQLLCERGKAALGEGNNSIGDLIPGLFAVRDLADIRVYLNDKTNSFLPPYDGPEQSAAREEHADFQSRDFWIWSRADTYRYFIAGGGSDSDFDALWSTATKTDDRVDIAVAAQTYARSGGCLGYLVAGRKRSDA